MNNNKPVLGLICARGGSKGVPGKNVRDFCGKPLIAWSIECARSCPEITDIVVSTDDEEIAAVARNYGAEVPFMRPPMLAQDKTRQIDAIAHALAFLKDQGREYRAVVLLQPTCPLRLPEDVSGALRLMDERQADTVITVTQEEGVMLSTFYNLDEDCRASLMFPAPQEGTLRQDYNAIYRRCGVVYILKPDYVLDTGALYGSKVCAYSVPKDRSYDIDSMFDWELTEWLMGRQIENGRI
jgi:CMP-N,N'-diacetyllegionaminic acid synthase